MSDQTAISGKRINSRQVKNIEGRPSLSKRPHSTNVRNTSRRIVNKIFDSTFLAVRRISATADIFRPDKKRNQARELISQLTELLASPSEIVRQSALQAYLHLPLVISEYRTLAFRGVTVGLRDSHPNVRLRAVVVLGQLIETHPDLWEYGIPLLTDCCHDPAAPVAKKSQAIVQNQKDKRGKIQNTYLVK